MKINDPMKLLKKSKKRGSNQHKSKYNKGFALIKVLASFVLIGIIIYSYNAYQADPQVFKHVFMGGSVASVEVKENDPLTPEERANIEKQAKLSEQELILMKQKTALDADYKTKSALIESQLEGVRKDRLSLK